MEFYRSRFTGPVTDVIQTYYQAVLQQELKCHRENRMSIKIQSKFRMYRLEKRFQQYRKASLLVQKFLRGTLARLLVKRNAKDVKNVMLLRYFSNQAIIIQKCFRGYYKRKYYHEFAARKKYLEFLKEKNDTFRSELKEYGRRELQQKQDLEEQFAREEFQRIAANLHHLSSTRIQPGVYNRPLLKAETVFDLKVETHLQTVFHKNYPLIKKKQQVRYKELEKEEKESPDNMVKSLINGGGGSIMRKKTKHFASTGKLKLAPL